MTAKERAEAEVRRAWEAFGDGTQNHWDTYAVCWEHLEKRRITLRKIQAIAWEVTGTQPNVVAMRRSTWLGMRVR